MSGVAQGQLAREEAERSAESERRSLGFSKHAVWNPGIASDLFGANKSNRFFMTALTLCLLSVTTATFATVTCKEVGKNNGALA